MRMSPRRLVPALAAAIMLGVLPACSTVATSTAATTTLCDLQTATVAGGAYGIQNNEWNSSAHECVTTDGTATFKVTASALAKSPHGSPGGYPFIYRGCHWGACTSGSGLPIPVAGIHPGTVTTTWRTAQPGASNVYNVAYDIWFNRTPTTSGRPDAAELMIWLNTSGAIQPAGVPIATGVSIGGRSYNVWLRQHTGWDTVTYWMTSPTTAVRNLDLQPLVADAISRGYLPGSSYLISVEAGFEMWRGGTGLATRSFSVNVARHGS